VAKGEKDPSVILTEVDLNDRTLWPWLGDWRSRIWREGPARAGEPTSAPRASDSAARGH
jgi:hypothetical protein